MDGRAYVADELVISDGIVRLEGRRATPDGRLLGQIELLLPTRALAEARREVHTDETP